jgi:hypothetical protein
MLFHAHSLGNSQKIIPLLKYPQMPDFLQPGGLPAISRGVSVATPPADAKKTATPAGSQKHNR